MSDQPQDGLLAWLPPHLAERSRRLNERPDRPSPLGSLAERAAVFVEDYPAPPFPAWSERLAARSPNPVLAVDCCCIVPMRAHPKRFSRAFDFRRASQRERERRLPLPWPETIPTPAAWFDGRIMPVSDGRKRFVAVPRLSALPRLIASDLAVRTRTWGYSTS
jgi:hypothetical protein